MSKGYSAAGKTVVGKKEIIEGLRGVGVEAGDAVFFHNSLSSMGYVEGGARTVVDAFLEAVGPKGTVAVHTCHFGGWHWHYARSKPNPAFDVRHSPSMMGRITEVFRRQDGATRCLDSSNPMCAIGQHAAYLAEGSVRCFTPCGRGTAWGKLGEIGAHYMFLGTGWNTCTLMHGCEEYAYAPYALMDEPSRLEVVDDEGRPHTHVQKVHTPNVPRDYAKIEPEMEARGLLRRGKIGDADVMVTCARDLIQVGTRCILEDPGFLLRDRTFLERCRDNQRGIMPEEDKGLSDV